MIINLLSVETKNNKDIIEIEQIANYGYQNEHPYEIFASIISDKIEYPNKYYLII